jgi:hypothetical protein
MARPKFLYQLKIILFYTAPSIWRTDFNPDLADVLLDFRFLTAIANAFVWPIMVASFLLDVTVV